uniref:Cytochrome b n=1 Tax=Lissoclinum sp. TIC-2013-079 TaxID=2010181 RepID=A0A2D1BXQ4_9ASCI|nr:cytochrome b [Lissoclinum sp. TIC-2013-079]
MSILLKYPTPYNLNYFWNIGSLIGIFMGIQILSGLFLTMFYSSYIEQSFLSVVYIMNDVNMGIYIRFMHMNGASFCMALIYLHLGRGLYYKGYYNYISWFLGVSLLLMTMAVAFFGYVLPWGQMSFWGATVITSMISVFPWGMKILIWLWGGFSVNYPTLSRFYTLHFFMPIIMVPVMFLHIYFIHMKGSFNPLGLFTKSLTFNFWPYFGIKNFLGFFFFFFFFFIIVFYYPEIFGEEDNYIEASSLITPTHIKPEWYFLFAYAMLRSIPNKLLGVLVMVFSILIFFLASLFSSFISMGFRFFFFFFWFFNWMILTFLGGIHITSHAIFLSQILGIFYFLFFFFMLIF